MRAVIFFDASTSLVARVQRALTETQSESTTTSQHYSAHSGIPKVSTAVAGAAAGALIRFD